MVHGAPRLQASVSSSAGPVTEPSFRARTQERPRRETGPAARKEAVRCHPAYGSGWFTAPRGSVTTPSRLFERARSSCRGRWRSARDRAGSSPPSSSRGVRLERGRHRRLVQDAALGHLGVVVATGGPRWLGSAPRSAPPDRGPEASSCCFSFSIASSMALLGAPSDTSAPGEVVACGYRDGTNGTAGSRIPGWPASIRCRDTSAAASSASCSSTRPARSRFTIA